MDKMREEFEKWLDQGNHCGCNENMWKAWQAAQSAAVPVAPDYSVTQLQRLKSLMSNLGLSTDESLEGFCLDADRQLSRAITAMEKTLAALMSVPVVGDVVALICDDCGAETNDPWHSSKGTNRHYHRCDPCNSISAAELERLQQCEDVLRSLACSLAVGGYIAVHVNPAAFEKKIRAGIDMLLAPLTDELDSLRKDAERKEELVRTMRHLRKTLEKIDKYRLCMSYNDSYFGEPEGTVKRVCSELQHCIDAAIAGEKNHG